MARRILHSISQEPPLLRWLHSHDPDRHITSHLLNASATYVTSTPPSELPFPTASIPPTASLFVPMYRRKQFVLGQLYGPLSPNAIALNILADAESSTPPSTISRRFVVDFSSPAINFLEYEWFSDGKLSVSMHFIDADGLYTGETILLDSPDISDPQRFARDDLLESRNRPTPKKVVTRIYIKEHLACQICYSQGLRCSCPQAMRDNMPRTTYLSPTNWESWVRALRYTRTGLTTTTVHFTMHTAMGEVSGTNTLFLNQHCEVGVSEAAPHANQLLKMFLASAGMLVSHPGTDGTVRAAEEKRDRIQLANDLSEDSDDWPPPDVITLPPTETDIDTLPQSTPYPVDPLQEPTLPTECLSSDRPDPTALPQASAFTSAISNALPDVDIYSRSVNLDPPVEGSDRSTSPYRQLKKEEVLPPQLPNTPAAPATTERQPSGLGSSSQRLGKRAGALTKRRSKNRGKLLVCPDCKKVFNHKGHYNEHRLCVHEKVKEHKCAFLNCQSRFFKRSDRDRHMRSKHDFTALVCSKCDNTLADKNSLEAHMREMHKVQAKHTCSNCNATMTAASALREHLKTCNPG